MPTYNLSNYAQSGVFNHLLRTASLTKPGTIAIALCSNPPTESSTGANCNELANTGAYARYPNASGDVFWSHEAPGSGNNIGLVTFTQATADWGYVSGVALVDSATYGAGNIIMYGQLVTPRIVLNGDQFKFNATNLTVVFD